MNKKVTISLIALFCIMLSICSYYGYQQLLSGFLHRDIEKYATLDQYVDGVDYYKQQISQGNKLIICKQDWLRPTIVNVYKDQDRVLAGYTNLYRDSIWKQDYMIVSPNDGESTEIYNLPFDQVVSLFTHKGCDFFKRNTDTPDNLEINGYRPVVMTYYAPITDEERKAEEARKQAKKIQDESVKTQQDEFEKLSSTEKALKAEKMLLQLQHGLAETDLSKFDASTIQQSKNDVLSFSNMVVTFKKDAAFDSTIFTTTMEQYLKEHEEYRKYYQG